jgi:aminomethyltransferase
MSTLKRTLLYSAQEKAGASFVNFGGWEMPVQFSSIVDEHLAVRRAGGVFDISHMGEFQVSGAGAAEFLNQTLTNDIRRLCPGQAQYTLMCNEHGGVVDDLYVYRLEDQKYLLIVNASRLEADWEWLQLQYDQSRVEAGIQMKDISEEMGALAVQGPRVVEIINHIIEGGSIGGMLVDGCRDLLKNQVGVFVFNGVTVYVARTGYTGEDGFEIVAPVEILQDVWFKVLAVGHSICLQPVGLGARDTLRTEVCYPLYGHELNEHTTPLEAGVGFFVALDKGDFIGRKALAIQKANGVQKRCVAFKMSAKSAPPRPGYPILDPDSEGVSLGLVTSGTQSPSLGIGIGMGYVPVDRAKAGNPLAIEIRGRRAAAEIVKKPIFKKDA